MYILLSRLFFAAFLLAGCSSQAPPAPPPAGPKPLPAAGLTFLPGVPARFQKVLREQYAGLPAHLRPTVNVRLGAQAELRAIANPNSHAWIGGVTSMEGRASPPTCPPRTVWLADYEDGARYTWLHELGHVLYVDRVIGRTETRWKAFFCAHGQPVRRFWKPGPDGGGFCGNPACGFGDVLLWAYYPQPAGKVPDIVGFLRQPCPANLKAELLAVTAP